MVKRRPSKEEPSSSGEVVHIEPTIVQAGAQPEWQEQPPRMPAVVGEVGGVAVPRPFFEREGREILAGSDPNIRPATPQSGAVISVEGYDPRECEDFEYDVNLGLLDNGRNPYTRQKLIAAMGNEPERRIVYEVSPITGKPRQKRYQRKG